MPEICETRGRDDFERRKERLCVVSRKEVACLSLGSCDRRGCLDIQRTDMARQSIQLDLHFIGRSIYEAHQKNGRWPTRIADLDGTEYLNMPYRKGLLEEGNFVVVWQQDLAPKPAANRERVLAYDNRSLLSRFGNVWVVRGDLRVEHMDRDELNELLEATQELNESPSDGK